MFVFTFLFRLYRGVSETVQKQRIANQLMHIERMLNETLSDPPNWLLVAGHYPIYSASTPFVELIG